MFENFRKKCLETCELDPVHFLSAPGLSWQACLKKARVKLELLTDNNMLMMVEKGIRGGICQATHRYAKANNICNKYMSSYYKNIEVSFLENLDANDKYGWSMCKKLLVDGFRWIEKDDPIKFDKNFIKNL